MKALRIVSDGEERQTDRDVNGSLAVQSIQRSPRHIWYNVPASINQSIQRDKLIHKIVFHGALVSRCHMVKPQRY
jgi:hypothetical protein